MFSDIRQRLRALLRRKKVEAELDEELRGHIERETAKYLESGMAPEEARRKAKLEFGGVEQTKEECRDARGVFSFEAVWRDLQYTLRMLRREPGFAVVAIALLGLGIGINTALFSFADAIVFRPLPVLRPSQVVSVANATPDHPVAGVSYPDYMALRSDNHSFSGMVAYQMTDLGVAPSATATPQMRPVTMVSDNFFRVLGIVPFLGRSFLPNEGRVPGRDRIAILGYAFWQNVYGSDRTVIGRQFRLNGIDFTIIGIAPRSFRGMNRFFSTSLFIPLSMWDQMEPGRGNPLEDRSQHDLTVQARLKTGVSIDAAQAELAGIGENLARAYPRADRDRRVVVESDFMAGIQQEPFRLVIVAILMALAALVLVIACANVGSLLLARGRTRSREVVIRLAVGAGRARLVQQLMTEGLVLGVLGGLAGMGLGYLGIRFLSTIRIPQAPSFSLRLSLDTRVMAFCLAVALASSLLFALAPAFHTTRVDLAEALKAGRGTASRNRKTMGRDALVVSQIALALVLLAVAGALVAGARNILKSFPGFPSDRLISMSLDPAALGYSPGKTREFYRELEARVQTLPSVRSATLAQSLPLSPDQSSVTVVPEGDQPTRSHAAVTVLGGAIDENYFPTLGVGIVRGRGFSAGDVAAAPRVAVVNQQFAKVYWPDQNPLGKQFRLNSPSGPAVRVVGIAKTGHYLLPWEAPRPYIYLPYAQDPRAQMTLIVESRGNPASLAAPLRGAVRAIDPNLPITNLAPVSATVGWAVNIWLTIVQVVTTMGLLGLILAMVGLYGVISYSVSRRIPEFGVRMAVGAAPTDLFRLVLRRGLILATVGLGIGTAIVSAVTPMVQSALVGAAAMDIPIFAAIALATLAVCATACYLPARRAARMDPVRALRYE